MALLFCAKFCYPGEEEATILPLERGDCDSQGGVGGVLVSKMEEKRRARSVAVRARVWSMMRMAWEFAVPVLSLRSN